MHCKYLWSFALSMVALAALTSALSADEEVRQPNSSNISELAQSRPLAGIGAKSSDTVKDASGATASATKTAIPTPAKHKPDHVASSVDVKGPSANGLASEPESADKQAKTKAADESLQPIPDAMESGPISIEPASFKGVTPGTSTKADVVKVWGQPKEIAKQGDNLVQLYSVEPFNRVEVSYANNKVCSVVVRFDRAFPADAVAKQLDLATVRPVLVSNELGEVLGLAYPERGVLFAFEAGKTPNKPSMKVSQLVLEPITAEPFVLRAETTIETRCDLSRRDIEQALALEPNNARAHWLHSRALASMEQYEKAATAASRAVQLESDNGRYRITYSQVLAQVGRWSEAVAEAEKAAETSSKRPHVKAQALCLVGDLAASGPSPDYKKAISFHTQALQLANPLTSDPHPAIRLAAKESLIDAHLGAAHDIAWGDWKEKNKAVARWLDRAVTAAEDLVKSEGGNREQVFRVYVRAMAAYAGVRGGIDPESTANAAIRTGDELIVAAHTPAHKAQLQGDLGLALYDAVQIYQMRSDPDNAVKYGEKAADYLAKANETKQSSASAFLLGRLYFRLGTIHAMHRKDHRAAVAWFDKALPLLERPSPEELAADLGRHGESFVSMGVSYWESGQRQKPSP